MGTKVQISENVANFFAKHWERSAFNTIQRYEVAREFWALILGFVVLRLATSIVSICTGFNFFAVELSGIVPDEVARKIVSVSLLAIVEIITAAFLFKMFKFIFAQRWALAGAMLLGAGVFYFVSFHTSTAGIRYYKTDTTAQSVTIEQKASSGRDSIAAYYDTQIQDYRTMIAQILPPAWNSGQLTTGQQSNKTELYDKIARLQADKASALKQYAEQIQAEKYSVQASANDEGEKYFIYVAIIMVLQLSANGVLCFVYSRIFHEKNRPDEVAGEVKQFCEEVAEDTNRLIKSQVSEQYGDYLRGVGRVLQTLRSFASVPDVTSNPSENQARTEQQGGEIPSEQEQPEAAGSLSTGQPAPAIEPPTQPAPALERHAQKVKVTGFAGWYQNQAPATPEQPPKIPYYENRNTKQPEGVAVCPVCGKTFVKNHKKQVYCCNPCKYQNHANKHGKPYKFEGVIYYPAN